MKDNRTGYYNSVLQTIFQGQLISLPIKNPKVQTMGGAFFSLFFLLVVISIYESFWTWIINIIKNVKMLKTKFPTLSF